ncbi:hypothetical protein COU00_02570 [Candidatus Falkowbacteria bacterium CG10_big_fil_rev_8_21_14_0_10_43_11]|uniref:Carbonic anhydrase n=1 Tax=Candidatus Falkowbacteria bacterium CG10_big_fil_rev_8_21_14_0_10_43_11 TaxID=1974568 RepID=A0A2M6WLU7_9BACT|nr:MAG: hypothetical protein COU00_02570 [Candidatus Falkowbacteria bacterium CG10_big_fil_rev_8_21_14_0_10_43_11]
MSKCKHLAIRCMDFRLSKKLFRWMAKRGYIGDCDELSYAGASKKIVNSESRSVVLADLELAVHKHGVCHIILVHHSHCGAYQK